MQFHRRLLASLIAIPCLGLALISPVEAGRPPDPYVSRMSAVVGWVTDPVTSDAYYVMEATVHVQNPRKLQELGYRVEFSDGTQRSDGGLLVPTADASGQSVMILSLGPVPDGATWVTFAAQVQRRGRGGCCASVGPAAEVTATLPERPAPPPAPSTWQLVFDRTFAAP